MKFKIKDIINKAITDRSSIQDINIKSRYPRFTDKNKYVDSTPILIVKDNFVENMWPTFESGINTWIEQDVLTIMSRVGKR